MLIAFTGSHGTGKTTTCQSMVNSFASQWPVFEDYYRKTVPLLGYQKPRNAVLEVPAIRQISSTAMTGASLGALLEWTQSLEKHGLIDMGPPSTIAYHRYWMNICSVPVSPFVFKMARYISERVDLFIYLPTNAIPLVEDSMRDGDLTFQKDIDQWVSRSLTDLNIPNDKVFTPQSSDLKERVDEILLRIGQVC